MSKQAYQLIHMQKCIDIFKYILKIFLNIFLNIKYIFLRSQLDFNNSNLS